MHGDHHVHAHQVTSMRLLTGVLIILLIMTAVTVFASRIDLGESVNLWLAIAIATFKAILVAAIFMHLLHDKAMNSIVLFYCILTILLFFFFTLIDMSSRGMIDPVREGPISMPTIVDEAKAAAIAGGRHEALEMQEGAEHSDESSQHQPSGH